MFDDSFEIFRVECAEWCHNRNKKLIEEWCNEAGVKSPVGYFNNLGKRILTIYTDRPGYLIGKGGCTINAFKEKMKEEYGYEYEIKFVEICGGFVNLNAEVE